MSALPSPVVLEALQVPPDHGLGLDDDEAFSPPVPGSGQPKPEDAVLGFLPWAFGPSVLIIIRCGWSANRIMLLPEEK